MGPERQKKSYSKNSRESFKNSQSPAAANPLFDLGQWLRELLGNFEIPHSDSPASERSLSDPIWRPMSEAEIAARGDGWDANYSLLKQMYGDVNENASEPINNKSKSSDPSNQSNFHTSKTPPNEELLPLTNLRNQDGVGDATIINSTSSNTTLCNSEEQTESVEEEFSGPSSSSSLMMETASGSLASSSDHSFHTADSQSDFLHEEQEEDFEEDDCQEFDSKSSENCTCCEDSQQMDDGNSDITTIRVSDDLPMDTSMDTPLRANIRQNSSLMGAPWLRHGIYSANRPFAFNGRTGPYAFTPVIHVQPIFQRLPLTHAYMTALSPWQSACLNASYNNFMALQWSTAAPPFLFFDQPTIPLIGHSIPVVPTGSYLGPTNIILTTPNVSIPLYDRATMRRMWQQQIVVQRQHRAASGVEHQQHQHQHQQQQQLQQQQYHQQQIQIQQQLQLQLQQQQQQQEQLQLQQQMQQQYSWQQSHPYRNSCYRRPAQNVAFTQTTNFNNSSN